MTALETKGISESASREMTSNHVIERNCQDPLWIQVLQITAGVICRWCQSIKIILARISNETLQVLWAFERHVSHNNVAWMR